MTIRHQATDSAAATLVDGETAALQALELMLNLMSDGLDHPELWRLIPELAEQNPLIEPVARQCAAIEPGQQARLRLQLLLGLLRAAAGAPREALDSLMPLSMRESQNVQVQGVLFHLEGLLDPLNPKYQLAGKVCLKPFTELDVLEASTHLCCASWLPTSTGNLAVTAWQQVWNGAAAQAIRASMLDGSYRHCNKRTCPTIQSGEFDRIDALADDPKWRDIVTADDMTMKRGPEEVNLSYDRTCNLSCPSCRTAPYAADDATRARYDAMQEREILPLLKSARTVFITGSGDPFASKNFRRLMGQLDATTYPDLKFRIMTNGMLLTPQQWAAFPSLHGRVEALRFSLDGATATTHELLRRGSRWSVVEPNLRFAGELLAAGQIDDFMITFIVQADNFREMGAAVDLAHRVGANHVFFARITNWGTFSAAEYAQKAVFVPGHPDYEAFLEACRDPRLQDPMLWPSDLDAFFSGACAAETVLQNSV